MPRIVVDAVERLRGKLWWSNIAVGLLPERFTMPQARRVFEAISGVTYEPSNFRRELEQSGLVRATGTLAKGGPGRPAAMYEFVERQPAWSLRRSRPPAMAAAPRADPRRPHSNPFASFTIPRDWVPPPSAQLSGEVR